MKRLMILGLLLCTMFAFGQKYSNGKVPTGDKSRIGSDVLRKGTKKNQFLVTIGQDSSLRYVDADSASTLLGISGGQRDIYYLISKYSTTDSLQLQKYEWSEYAQDYITSNFAPGYRSWIDNIINKKVDYQKQNDTTWVYYNTDFGNDTIVAAPPARYKVYTALLTQSGTSAPTATVLENTLGGTIVWTRDSDGIYYGTLAGLFAEPKSFILIGTYFEGVIGNTIRFGAIRYDDNTVQVTTDEAATVGTGDDGLLYFTSLEIRVYN